MPKLMAIVALLCGTAGAYAANFTGDWCSGGFGKPAVFSDISQGWVLTVGGKKTETFDDEDEGFHFRTLIASKGLEDLPQVDIVSSMTASSGPVPAQEPAPACLTMNDIKR
jgi:hypothetical protein